jgi:hypothetical protein
MGIRLQVCIADEPAERREVPPEGAGEGPIIPFPSTQVVQSDR